MAAANSTQTDRAKSSQRRLVTQRIFQISVLFLLMGGALFLSAGHLDWWEGWAFLIAYFAIALATMLWMSRYDPELASERGQWGENTQAWDKVIVTLNSLLLFGMLVVVGLDAGQFGWSTVPFGVRLLALLGFIPAFGLPVWASSANTYLSGTVRIQKDRGHQVVTAGPYRIVRHPMYLGMILYDTSLPLLLGSWWGLAVGGTMIALVVVRTALEDKTLLRELDGYAEYAQRVRYRLLPGVW
jgi:protein-S-isoprenylcysteine O-methyltransferase Ste14